MAHSQLTLRDAEAPAQPRSVLLDHGYWPAPARTKRTRVPFLALWVQRDIDPAFPWEALSAAGWGALELWARAAGGIVRLFFGADQPYASVTYHTYASEETLNAAYALGSRPHWDWCDDAGQFGYQLDEQGRPWVASWFPDNPEDHKIYYLAWDDSRAGYWVSCREECPYILESALPCTIPEAVTLSELFLDYEPFAAERAQQRLQRLAEKQGRIRTAPSVQHLPG